MRNNVQELILHLKNLFYGLNDTLFEEGDCRYYLKSKKRTDKLKGIVVYKDNTKENNENPSDIDLPFYEIEPADFEEEFDYKQYIKNVFVKTRKTFVDADIDEKEIVKVPLNKIKMLRM